MLEANAHTKFDLVKYEFACKFMKQWSLIKVCLAFGRSPFAIADRYYTYGIIKSSKWVCSEMASSPLL